MLPEGNKMAPGTPQNGFPRLPNRTLTLQNHSKAIQDEKRRSKSDQGRFFSIHVDGLSVILGSILDKIWVKNGVKSRMSFRGRFFDSSKLIICEILDSPNFILKRPYSEFEGFSILVKIALEGDLG